jgi:AcrR family transcriptional regulator
VPPATYHHGDLPNTLRAVAADLLAEQGVAGFSLREVARRAEVSHAAPAHHFGDAAGLLTSVAIEGFTHLTERTRATVAAVDDPAEALAALGRAYVSIAIEHPGHCAVLFRKDALRPDDPDYRAAGEEAFSVLVGAVQRLADERAPALDVLLASQLCWAAMQGLVGLYPTMAELGAHAGLDVPAIEVLAERFTALMIAGMVPGAREDG